MLEDTKGSDLASLYLILIRESIVRTSAQKIWIKDTLNINIILISVIYTKNMTLIITIFLYFSLMYDSKI